MKFYLSIFILYSYSSPELELELDLELDLEAQPDDLELGLELDGFLDRPSFSFTRVVRDVRPLLLLVELRELLRDPQLDLSCQFYCF